MDRDRRFEGKLVVERERRRWTGVDVPDSRFPSRSKVVTSACSASLSVYHLDSATYTGSGAQHSPLEINNDAVE